MTLDEKISECKKFKDEADKAKDIARVSDNNLEYFKKAADLYNKTAGIALGQILIDANADDNLKVKCNALVSSQFKIVG
jgi:hypothetical protein